MNQQAVRVRTILVATAALSCTIMAGASGGNDTFTIGLEEVVSDSVPGPGAGNIESPGVTDEYTLNVPAGTVVFFDELAVTTCDIAWQCEDSNGDIVFTDNCIAVNDPGLFTLGLGGTYTITVFGEGDATGTYSFTIWEVNPTDSFAITLKDIVADGVPGPGAGNIEEAGTLDEYTFNVPAGTVVFFDELAVTTCDIAWQCEDSNGDIVFTDNCIAVNDPGLFTLGLGGTYTITVFGEGDATGTYSFTIWEVNPTDSFAITLKDIVADGVPGPGAGNIEEAGTLDEYTFNVPAGTVVFFDELANTTCSIAWQCEDSNGDIVFTDNCIAVNDPGLFTLALGGTYTITVFGEGDATGTYSFTIWEVNPTDSFAITLKDIVADGVPGPGAGNIEEAGTLDEYTFNVPAGTVVFFDELANTTCSIAWQCADSNGDIVFTDNCIAVNDPGLFTLALGGTYTITVFGEGDATGTYSFTIWEVNPTDSFAITLKDIVADGVPGPGAGNIEEAGTLDEYTFNVPAGTVVFFDELANTTCSIAWQCADSNGDIVFTDNCIAVNDPGLFTLALGGTYTITVFGEGDATGTYSFTIWEVNPTDSFAIDYGDVVSDGVPGPGAGNIEEAGTLDVYTFVADPDEEVCFDELANTTCSIAWQCEDSNGDIVFTDNCIAVNDPGSFTLGLGGTYTITVFGEGDATGTYSFRVNLVRAADLNDDCVVDVSDLLIVLGAWGGPDGDVDGDGTTDVTDLLLVLGEWG